MELAPARVRTLHYGLLAGAVVLALLGLLVFTGAPDAAARLTVIVLLVVLLVVEVGLYVRARRAPIPVDEGWHEAVPEEGAAEEQRIVIRCKQCGEVFPVEDDGARPLVATCPHCGKSGTIKVKSHA